MAKANFQTAEYTCCNKKSQAKESLRNVEPRKVPKIQLMQGSREKNDIFFSKRFIFQSNHK